MGCGNGPAHTGSECPVDGAQGCKSCTTVNTMHVPISTGDQCVYEDYYTSLSTGTGTLLSGQVEGDAALDRLDLLGLALIHDLAGEALGSKLLHEALDLLVEWAKLLLLGDLCPEELVIENLELELGSIAASLLLVVHLILEG